MRKRRTHRPAFVLVISLLLMALILLVALGLTGLASIEIRRSAHTVQDAQARANARLALMLAIGQLQRTLGPDQRVSATAEISGKTIAQPHWTGVWRTTMPDGKPILTRDDLAGGLSDARATGKVSTGDLFMEWLVSGQGDPISGTTGPAVLLHRAVGTDAAVSVPKIAMKRENGTVAGHHAWWTGDLGLRANLKTIDPRGDLAVTRNDGGSQAWFRVMASQAADSSLMEGGVEIPDDEMRNLASASSMSLTRAGELMEPQTCAGFHRGLARRDRRCGARRPAGRSHRVFRQRGRRAAMEESAGTAGGRFPGRRMDH